MLISILKSCFSVGAGVAILGLSSQVWAKPNYPMTVVKEAWVDHRPHTPEAPENCQDQQSLSVGSQSLGWKSQAPSTRSGRQILKLDRQRSIYATQNFDGYVNNRVTLWLGEKEAHGMTYYALTELDMERVELPQIQKDGDALLIEADTLSADPSEEEEIIQTPLLQQTLRQTIKIAGLSDKGLVLNLHTCTRSRR